MNLLLAGLLAVAPPILDYDAPYVGKYGETETREEEPRGRTPTPGCFPVYGKKGNVLYWTGNPRFGGCITPADRHDRADRRGERERSKEVSRSEEKDFIDEPPASAPEPEPTTSTEEGSVPTQECK